MEPNDLLLRVKFPFAPIHKKVTSSFYFCTLYIIAVLLQFKRVSPKSVSGHVLAVHIVHIDSSRATTMKGN